ncbi:cupin domain-containing protein [Saccharothrix texasensis]|uniref:cupin domain-containing protein n=1 Tax=Saccharothrix texasensis TaxID=103734 RepID=UPI003CCC8848
MRDCAYASSVDVFSDVIGSIRVGRPTFCRTSGSGAWGRSFDDFTGAGFHVLLRGAAAARHSAWAERATGSITGRSAGLRRGCQRRHRGQSPQSARTVADDDARQRLHEVLARIDAAGRSTGSRRYWTAPTCAG